MTDFYISIVKMSASADYIMIRIDLSIKKNIKRHRAAIPISGFRRILLPGF